MSEGKPRLFANALVSEPCVRPIDAVHM